MEKNLNKYLSIEEASKQHYITPHMINLLVQNNKLPYFNDKGTVKVFPGDVAAAINELFGVEEKKAQRKAKALVPSEEPVAVGESVEQS